ncbi:MAG: response regulator transcription factor [Dehalococcoidia bacterium]|nr:response regulator transcription factor [Dehalococcoidia bacterium]
MISIVLADDHHVVRQGLRALLEAQADLRIIGEAADGLEAARITENLQPDVLVLDLMMDGMNGLEVTRQVTKRAPSTSVVILSMHGNEAYVLEALRAGAKAYVLKDSTSSDLVNAIHSAVTGHHYLSSPLSERAIESYLQRTESAEIDPYDTLTTREREVLHLAAQGSTSTEIASRLQVSPRTIETHRANMMHKLGLRTQNQLLRYAIRRGILPAED